MKTNVDLTELTVELHSIGIQCTIKLPQINFT